MENDFSIEQESQPFIDFGWLLTHITGPDGMLTFLWQHLILSLVPVTVALIISIPIGILAHRKRWLYGPITAFTGILYTIPSLAFFVMLIPIMGIGRPPVLVALTAYSLLILIRNTVTGLDSVPEDTKDAARGMGLTERQILTSVEIPLALPVIVAGIRIATVTVIGIASIAAYIGAGGLGKPIFDGIGSQFATPVFAAAVLIAVVAISADVGLYRIEGRLRPWARRAGGAA
ncbi:MAG: ABC transporter permease [Rubrobacteraceae bacterium]